MPTIVLDNGASSIKVGLAGETAPTKIIPNYAVRPRRENRLYVGDQMDLVLDHSSLYFKRPMSKGLVVDWDFETEIWRRVFSKPVMNIKPHNCTLVATEAMFNPSAIRSQMDEIVFETFGFEAFHRTSSPALSVLGYQHQAKSLTESKGLGEHGALVVDSGYSFTHTVPVFNGVPLNYAARRINLGGKALANYLKELISFRVFNMMEETHAVETIARESCFVSLNYLQDLQLSKKVKRSPYRKTFILPGPSESFNGKLKDIKDLRSAQEDDQTLTLNNERFAVPEALFNPSDLGLMQGGIVESIVESINAAPPPLRPVLYNNVLLVGGNALLPNFKERVQQDLRSLAPSDCKVRVVAAPDPVSTAWAGGSILANAVDFARKCVTKQEWQEYGETICYRKFTHD